MSEKKQSRALIFAAPPPPLGGVSSLVSMLKQSLSRNVAVVFASPLVKQRGIKGVLRPLVNLWRLARAARFVARGERVLFFSSAGASFFEKLGWLIILRLSRRHAVMVMVDGNFPNFWHHLPAFAQQFARALTINASVTIGVQSEQWRNYYKGILPGSDCVQISATVTQEFLETEVPCELPESSTVLYVGWMIAEKGVLDLLDAFMHLHAHLPRARLRMVGPLFSGADYWQGQARQRGIEGKVEFAGPIHDRQALIDEYRFSAVFVLPSHVEGFPVALLEAMSLGLPCVGSEVGGIPDILDYGAAGVIVPPRNPMALANALEILLTDPSRRQALSAIASKRVRSEYSEVAFSSSYLKILDIK
jgi:glycosyltransferase involved in cell wall biosynthesis